MIRRLLLMFILCLNSMDLPVAAQANAAAPGNTSTSTGQEGNTPSRTDVARAKQIVYSVDALPEPVEKKRQLEEAYRLVKDAAEDSLINLILFKLAFNANISGDWAKGFEWAMVGMDRIGSDSTSYVFPAFAIMFAQSFEKQRDYTTALLWAKKSIRSEETNNHRLFLVENRWAARMVAAKYMAILRYPLDSCLFYARESIRLGNMDSIPESNFAYSYQHMAIAFDEYGRRDSAISYFHRALSVFRETGNAFSAQETERDLARLFLRENRPDSALYYAQKAYDAAPSVNNWDVRMDAAGMLATVYERKDAASAIIYLKEYLHLKDSLFNRDKYNEIALIRTDEQLKARDAAEKERRLRNRVITYGLLAGLALMVFTGLFLYRSNQVRKKINEQLERKNRELEIEAALEKVRGRTMAMHHSDELKDVITVFFEKTNELNVLLGTVGIALFDQETGNLWFWIGNAIQDPQLIYVPYDKALMQEENFVRDGWRAMTDKHEIINKVYSRKQKDQYFNHLFSHNSLATIPEHARQFLGTIDRHTVCFFPNKHSALFADGWDERQYPEAHIAILRRAGQVFEQAYVRFLDLQKAEAQAREADIQLGLERLRSRTMAMHKSEELSDAASVMYQQLSKLGADLWICGFNICHPENKHVEAWISPPGGLTMEPLWLPMDIDAFTEAGFHAWQNKSGIYTDIREGQSLKEEHEMLLANPIMDRPRQYIEAHQIVPPNWVQRFAVPYSYGFLTIITTKEFRETAILDRFAAVFDQTYRRFLDLQKAEAQAREAQIEAALERVRSASMAMQHSDQLAGVVRIMYKQLEELQFGLYQVLVSIFDLDKNVIEWWSKGFGEDNLPQRNIIPIIDHPLPNQQLEAWKNGTEYREYVLGGADKVSWEDYLFTETDLRHFPEHVKAQMRSIDSVCLADAYMKCGVLQAAGTHPLSEKEADILRRFARVLDQSYTRMMDLQKAEQQAHQAHIETALERVRARALAMQEPEELVEVAQLLRQEMGALGIESLETGTVFIHDEGSDRAECWFAIRDDRLAGKPLVSDHISLDLDTTWVGREMMKFYNSDNTQVSIPMRGEHRREWIEYCYSLSSMLNGYYGKHIPDRIYHLYKFSNGAIGAAAPGEISAESWDLLQRTASVFSLAYSRFKDLSQARTDLQRLKAEKHRAETALSELKSTQAQLIQAEKMASLGELTAGIAHEIQNPLNFVNNFSEINAELAGEIDEAINRGDMDEIRALASDIKSNQEKIREHGKRADSIVKGMLQHSRSSTGVKEPTDINKLADEYLRLAYHGFRAKDKSFNVSIQTNFDPSPGAVSVVPQDIGRVLLNLFNNAFYAVQDRSRQGIPGYEPTVTVSIKTVGNQVAISVADNGPGIPDAIKDKIFQPFFTTKPTGQGTGLGLSLSYDIIRAHGGEITVQSEEEKGTSFNLLIPA